MKSLPLIVVLLFAVLIQAHGQAVARLQGLLTHLTSPISNATVTLLNTPYTTTTHASGEFQITDIPPGVYSLHIVADGYADAIREITLTPGNNTTEIPLEKREQQLDEIIVTADKSVADMQSLPLGLTVLTTQDLNESRVWDIRDLTAIVPGMYASNPGDLRNVVSLRGITTTSYEPAVATYVDGVNQFSLDSYIAQLNDIERVEILRGPQGTLYGRNATGGVINIITKQPENRTKGFVEVDFGNFGLQRYTGAIQTPVIANKLFVGLAGMFTQRDGFYNNTFDHSSYDDMKLSQGNYFVKYQHNKRFSVNLNIKHQRQHNEGAFPLVMGANEALEQPFELDQNRQSTMQDRTFNVSLTAIYQTERLGLNSQTSFQDNHRIYKNPIDGDFSSFDIIAIVNDYGKNWNRPRVWMHETRLSSRHNDKLDWNVGVYGFLQNNPVKQGTYYGDDAGMYGSPMTNFTDIGINNLRGHGLAGFGQIAYKLFPRVSIIAGLRYDYEHKQQSIEGLYEADGAATVVTRTDTSTSANFKDLSPKLALSYNWGASSQLYGVYSSGFRAGGISALSSDPSAPPLMHYDPEKSSNFELGSKNMFLNKRLRVNVALFYTKVKNGQIPVMVMPEALTLIRNTAEMSSRGAEVELSAVHKGLELDYSFAFTDAYYTDLLIAGDDGNRDFSKNKQIFTPKTTSYFGLQYVHTLSANSKTQLFARLEHRNIGKQYFDLANSISQNSYHLLNGRAGIRFRKMELALWGANLADKTYISYAYDFGAVHLGTPRTYGLSLKTAI